MRPILLLLLVVMIAGAIWLSLGRVEARSEYVQGVRALLRCEGVPPRAPVEVLRDGVRVGHATLAPDRAVAVTLPVGRVTLHAVVEGGASVDHEVLVEPGTAPQFTFDGAWR
ncbi:MAG: hypothetical protein NTY35_07935 [Planctomycetota bacterium]|nr:hypothetical protein [Planctomycetota bacterium]